MAYALHPATDQSAKALRKQAGQLLKGLRMDRNLTQRELANRVGIDYYTFISQVEVGSSRVPFESIPKWAEALGVDRKWLAKELLRYYDPALYETLFV